MEVKEIVTEHTTPEIRTEIDRGVEVATNNDGAVKVNTEHHSQDIRAHTNNIIDAINLAVSNTHEISALFKGISGIVEQLGVGEISDKRISILEKEAQELIQAIQMKALQASSGEVRPLAGDSIRLEVERELGKTLELILPDSAIDAFGLTKLDFSRKEAIINTRTAVARAQAQLEDLQSAVNISKVTIESAVTQLEIAWQNSEASRSSVRDLEEAMQLAGFTSNSIGADPSGAVNSHKRVNNSVVELLK